MQAVLRLRLLSACSMTYLSSTALPPRQLSLLFGLLPLHLVQAHRQSHALVYLQCNLAPVPCCAPAHADYKLIRFKQMKGEWMDKLGQTDSCMSQRADHQSISWLTHVSMCLMLCPVTTPTYGLGNNDHTLVLLATIALCPAHLGPSSDLRRVQQKRPGQQRLKHQHWRFYFWCWCFNVCWPHLFCWTLLRSEEGPRWAEQGRW